MKFDTLSTRYTGGIAADYEAERTVAPQWAKEQAATERFLATLPAGATILDVPVGTGRFLEFYKKFGLVPTGLDISPDMLASAKAKAAALNLDIKLAQGDIRRLDAADKGFEAALCVRFVNWIDFAGTEAVLAELSRVARSTLIVSVRVWPTPRTFAQRLGQAWTNFRRRKAELNFHNTEATEALFGRLGFIIADSETVFRKSNQTSYVFYLLHRKPA
ncbi:MAG TPA: class I SAM-dependent methyltransferase [Rhizomicrobium sp.]|nr:class I SAM-dependent methyltransferase [Rhizomicrobium sp.]